MDEREALIARAWEELERRAIALSADSVEDLRQEVALAVLEAYAESGGNGQDIEALVGRVVGRYLREEGQYHRRFKLAGYCE